VVEGVRRRVAWIAPVAIHPGEDELRALCEGALRVLAGEEPARAYPPPERS
jgi:butyrate kinase